MIAVKFSWDSKCRPKPGETECGDAVFVRTDGDVALFCAIDALGHGPQAAEAAHIALATLAVHAAAPLPDVVNELHRALHGSRGAAATLVRVSERTLQACGIGNVALHAKGLAFLGTPGVLGSRLPRVRFAKCEITSRLRLLMHTDGVSSRVAQEPVDSVAALFEKHARDVDDATLLIADIDP